MGKNARHTETLARFPRIANVLATVGLLALGCASTADSADERPLESESTPSLTDPVDDVRELGFVEITAGHDHTCALRRSGEIVCWGRNDSGQASPCFGAFRSVVAGGDQTCGLRPTGEAQCWGYDMADSPLSGIFAAVSMKNSGDIWFACGLRRTGKAECWAGAGETSWADREEPQPFDTMPSGTFAEIVVGAVQVCGLRPSGEAVCWNSGLGHNQETPRRRRLASSRRLLRAARTRVVCVPTVKRFVGAAMTTARCQRHHEIRIDVDPP